MLCEFSSVCFASSGLVARLPWDVALPRQNPIYRKRQRHQKPPLGPRRRRSRWRGRSKNSKLRLPRPWRSHTQKAQWQVLWQAHWPAPQLLPAHPSRDHELQRLRRRRGSKMDAAIGKHPEERLQCEGTLLPRTVMRLLRSKPV